MWCSSLLSKGWECEVTRGSKSPGLPLYPWSMQQELPVYQASHLPPTGHARRWAQEAGRGCSPSAQTPAEGGLGKGGEGGGSLPASLRSSLPSSRGASSFHPSSSPLLHTRRLWGCRRERCQQTRPLSAASGMCWEEAAPLRLLRASLLPPRAVPCLLGTGRSPVAEQSGGKWRGRARQAPSPVAAGGAMSAPFPRGAAAAPQSAPGSGRERRGEGERFGSASVVPRSGLSGSV